MISLEHILLECQPKVVHNYNIKFFTVRLNRTFAYKNNKFIQSILVVIYTEDFVFLSILFKLFNISI